MLHFLVAPGCAPTARLVRENADSMVVFNVFLKKMLTVWLFFNDFGSGPLLELSRDLLVPSCAPLGGPWRLLGSFLGLAWSTWAPLGASWAFLGSLLGPSCWLLGVSRWPLPSLWESLGPLWEPLGLLSPAGKATQS